VERQLSQTTNLPGHVKPNLYSMLLPVIYGTGMLLLFFKLLFSIVKIIRLKDKFGVNLLDGWKVVRIDTDTPFSFFNIIFLPQEVNSLVFEHEKNHVCQLHWLDLLFIESAALLLWFNPVIFLYRKSLKLQHEYLADNKVLKKTDQIRDYLECMLRQVQRMSSGKLVSQFYCTTIKNRIIMITKNKTPKKNIASYLLVLPLIALLVLGFSPRVHSGPAALSDPIVEDFYGAAQDSVTGFNRQDNIPSIYPVDKEKLKRKASGYGWRFHPKTKEKRFHTGIDFNIQSGEEIYSTADGIIIKSAYDQVSGKGNYVLVRHNDEFSTLYSHMESIAVKTGDQVKKGQVIGFVGSTGASTGPHLHYEVHKDGKAVNPIDYLPE
jgi:hypothetical protein